MIIVVEVLGRLKVLIRGYKGTTKANRFIKGCIIMSKKPKASQNKAKDVVQPKPKSYILPENLRQMVIQALLTSTPKTLSVGEVNQICNALNQLKEVKVKD